MTILEHIRRLLHHPCTPERVHSPGVQLQNTTRTSGRAAEGHYSVYVLNPATGKDERFHKSTVLGRIDEMRKSEATKLAGG